MPGHFTYIVIKKLCLWSVSSTICIDKRREKESNTSNDSLNQMCSDSTGSERLSLTAVGLSALERNVFSPSLRAVFDNPDPLVQQGCFVPHQEIEKALEPFVVQITPERALNGVPPWVYNSQHVKNLSDRTEKCCCASCGSNRETDRKEGICRHVGSCSLFSLCSGSESESWLTDRI